MSKHIGAHLLQSDGSAQPASKAKPAAKKPVKKAKKEESDEDEAADDSEEESPPPKKVAKKMTKKQGNLFMGIGNCSDEAHSTHCAFSSNLFHGHIVQKYINQMSQSPRK